MHVRPSDWIMLCALAAIWGSSLLFIKLGLHSVPPLSVAAGRVLIPLVAVGAGVSFLGETVSRRALLALAFVLAGLWLSRIGSVAKASADAVSQQ